MPDDRWIVARNWGEAMRQIQLSRSTRDQRRSQLRSWLRFAGHDWRHATRHDVNAWVDACGGMAASRYGRISNLHAFYVWARREDLTDHDPTELVSRPKIPHRLPRPMRMTDVDLLITVASPIMAVTLGLMVDAGLRCCEVSSLTWEDVDLEARTLIVRGKGNTDRMVGIPRRLLELLISLEHITGPVVGARPSAISQRVTRHMQRHGVTGTAHRLRHTYATRLLAATRDITIVQRALGHAQLSSTQIYAEIDVVRAVAAAQFLDGRRTRSTRRRAAYRRRRRRAA